MITYRKAEPLDWPRISQLVDEVFQEPIPMAVSFPLLFSGNPFSYVALADQEIVGFIGVLPEELVVGEKVYIGCRIGAVCTATAYQKKGIGRRLFRMMKEAAQRDLDFVLVSGQGQLYLSEGCELFGEFGEFTIPAKEGHGQLLPYSSELGELFAMNKLFQQQVVYFKQSASQLQQLIEAQALANLFGSQQEIFLRQENDQIIGCLISCQRREKAQTLTEIIAYGGSDQVVIEMLQELAVSHLQVVFRAPLDSSLARELKRVAPWKVVQNAGTILYLNQTVRTCQVPHTWDLGFL